MSPQPPSLGAKIFTAAATWIVLAIVAIPLWDLADMWFDGLRFGYFPSLLEPLFNPLGTFLGLMLLFMMRAEDGIGPLVSHYWPVVPIASAFTAFLLRPWWRRG
ncbi:MAG: hypothetical protein Q8N31_09990 [Reyranella sp.]|nr:hypothetical protein [Reyranella sp.]MDP3160335.1 hypothetical protein [Reyranella sp.]